jgi:hypothetical protein
VGFVVTVAAKSRVRRLKPKSRFYKLLTRPALELIQTPPLEFQGTGRITVDAREKENQHNDASIEQEMQAKATRS